MNTNDTIEQQHAVMAELTAMINKHKEQGKPLPVLQIIAVDEDEVLQTFSSAANSELTSRAVLAMLNITSAVISQSNVYDFLVDSVGAFSALVKTGGADDIIASLKQAENDDD